MTVVALSLKQCMELLHVIYTPQKRGVDEGGGVLTTYVVSLSRVFKLEKLLVPGCLVVAHSVGLLREHFMYRHF